MVQRIRYAGYPSAVVYDAPGGKPVQHLLWGDWLSLLSARPRNGWHEVRARGVPGWMKAADIQENRLLEIVFVDIGQGDGALVVTPDDRKLLIDAGQGDNMSRFLRWRFNRRKVKYDALVISHSDQDHYKGFNDIIADENVSVDVVFHNGLVERKAKDVLGPLIPKDGITYVADIVQTNTALRTLMKKPQGAKAYPKLLSAMIASKRVGSFRAVSVHDKYLPGYEPSTQRDYRIAVLGPVVEGSQAKPLLRWFGDAGKTKNGHSVVLAMEYGAVRILLGGDLNSLSEDLLLCHHAGVDRLPEYGQALDDVISAARRSLRCDVAKACHHGSADYTEPFLRAVDPIATVISSGDDEPHAHPRADALGGIGRWARNRRPLIFSTELARSAKEAVKHPEVLRQLLREASEKIAIAKTEAARAKAREQYEKILGSIDRSVAVYGAINLRTDGQRVVMAYKLERENKLDKKWDIYRLEPDAQGSLQYVSKHR